MKKFAQNVTPTMKIFHAREKKRHSLIVTCVSQAGSMNQSLEFQGRSKAMHSISGFFPHSFPQYLFFMPDIHVVPIASCT